MPRPGEIHGKDYYFLERDTIEQLPTDKYVVGRVREMLQGVDLVQLEQDLRSEEPVIVEIFHDLWPGLNKAIKKRLGGKLRTVSVFLTAINVDALRHRPVDVASDQIKDEVRGILEWRGKDPVDEIYRRAESAVDEIFSALKNPGSYDKIIYSAPEGPDSQDDWTRSEFPTGQGARAFDEFVSLCSGKR